MAAHDIDWIHITDDESGTPIRMAIHRLSGSRPGPTLAVCGTQHGDEWFCISLFVTMLARVLRTDFAGQVVLIPVANPPALRAGRRIAQPDSDAPDLNRSWPGTNTWLSGQIAGRLASDVLDGCDALIDVHTGCWGVAWGATQYGDDINDADIRARSRALALQLGLDCVQAGNVLRHFPGPASLTGYVASQLGRPAVSAWLGGPGFAPEAEREFHEAAARGVYNAMCVMNMVDDTPQIPSRVLHFSRDVRINPLRGGLLRPAHDPERLRRRVDRGEPLGSVINPQTLQTLEEVTAPTAGFLIYLSRPRMVGPGDWAFGVASQDNATWLTADDVKRLRESTGDG